MEDDKVFALNYNDVAQYLFESLVELAYAPSEDEVLDLADIVMDLIINIHTFMGVQVDFIESEEDDE